MTVEVAEKSLSRTLQHRLTRLSALLSQNLLGNVATPGDPADPHPPAADIDPQWNSLFSDMDVRWPARVDYRRTLCLISTSSLCRKFCVASR